MKKIILPLILVLFLISFISASVSLENPPNEFYNLKDKIEITAKITPEGEINDIFILKLICGGIETDIYKEYLYLTEETTKNILIPLVKEFVGESIGECVIRSHLGETVEIISEKFKISDLIKINLNEPTKDFSPKETITFEGIVLRENGKNADGVVEVILALEGNGLISSADVEEGKFSVQMLLPDNLKAGEKSITIKAYETNAKGQITNHGESYSKIEIRQVPTNIEIVMEEKEILPGDYLKAKILLHDQTGERINSIAYIAIKNQNGEIVEKIEKETDVNFEYKINENELPNIWSISTYSEEISNELQFKIKENEKINTELINKTLLLTNVGNVPYNESLEIIIGEEKLIIPVYLELDQTEKYFLSAPDGEYEVGIGETKMIVFLTGNVIKAEKIADSKLKTSSMTVWIFLIFILGIMAFFVFRRGVKKSFFGRFIPGKSKKIDIEESSAVEKSNAHGFISPNSKASLSLSISGSKQNACIGCINFKNYEEIKSGEGNVRETLKSIVENIESEKGLIFQNKSNLFFILAPVKTKTFQNEMIGIHLSEKANILLKEHNKKFKQKIDYGISLNYGTIITKQESKEMKFMSMGTLLTTAKKLATTANQEIFISDSVKKRLSSEIKTDVKEIGSITAHIFKEILNKTAHSKFIDGFIARQKKEIAEKEKQ